MLKKRNPCLRENNVPLKNRASKCTSYSHTYLNKITYPVKKNYLHFWTEQWLLCDQNHFVKNKWPIICSYTVCTYIVYVIHHICFSAFRKNIIFDISIVVLGPKSNEMWALKKISFLSETILLGINEVMLYLVQPLCHKLFSAYIDAVWTMEKSTTASCEALVGSVNGRKRNEFYTESRAAQV